MASPWARRMRTHAEWNVAMSGARIPAGASSASTRRAISPAALLVKVTARTWRGCTPRTPSRWAMRCAMTRVLPLPAPASTSSGPSPARTASRGGGLRLLESRRGMGVQTPVLVMGGCDSTQVAIEALEKGATGYLPKPFDLIHLDRLIAHALGQPAA